MRRNVEAQMNAANYSKIVMQIQCHFNLLYVTNIDIQAEKSYIVNTVWWS